MTAAWRLPPTPRARAPGRQRPSGLVMKHFFFTNRRHRLGGIASVAVAEAPPPRRDVGKARAAAACGRGAAVRVHGELDGCARARLRVGPRG
eukprot:scaffold11206_cov117-Isochrysis_galbana.AAC.11